MSKFQRILALFSLFLLIALKSLLIALFLLNGYNLMCAFKFQTGTQNARSIQALNGGGSGYHSFAPM
jgi:hypothetical protein